MSLSAEYLDMDKGDAGPGKRRGFFVSHRCLAAAALLVLAALVVVGLATRYLSPEASGALQHAPQEPSAPVVRVTDLRLPRSVQPLHYEVELSPRLFGDFAFTGAVAVTMHCLSATDAVVMHSKDLNVSDVSVEETTSNVLVPCGAPVHDAARQFLRLPLHKTLSAGTNYTLRMRFRGWLNDDLAGFYRSSYTDAAGNKRWLAATQFQATDARRAFPCFDEPDMKATFAVTMVRPSNLTAISNMPLKSSVDRGNGLIADTFETTVKMSTYLLAFVVSDFQFHGNEKFKVWARADAITAVEYSLSIGPRILEYYEEYFSIKYPLPKTDMIALPDFSAGAMENWGLVTFRETSLLFNKGASSSYNKQRVAEVVAHELAHQWFGNLVTMEWWDDLWLNEGFATYVEYIGTDVVHKDWGMLDQIVVNEVQSVMELDALKSSHPVSVPVDNPDEISENFDKISYSKGASIIRMMCYFLTEKIFRKGVTNYLRKRAYANAKQDDLWAELTMAQVQDPPVDVKKVMDTWTLQTGFPVVTVNRSYDQRTAVLTQKRFLLDEGAAKSVLWQIPITYTDSVHRNWNDTTPRVWLNDESVSISQLPAASEWFIANVQEVGYYKVNYDERNWNLLITQLLTGHTEIHENNRAQIIDDILDLARAGVVDYKLALKVTEYLPRETEYIPWDAAFSNLLFLGSRLDTKEVYGIWMKYVLTLIKPNYDRLSWDQVEGESVLTSYLRADTYSIACKYGQKDCVDHAVRLLQSWRSNAQGSNPINPDYRPFVYCTAVAHGDYDDWQFLWRTYNETKDASEKSKILSSLGCSKEPWILTSFLEKVITPSSGIRRQDGAAVFTSVGSSVYGRSIAFNFLLSNWAQIHKMYAGSAFTLPRVFSAATGNIRSRFELDQLKTFYKQNQGTVSSIERTYRQTVERAEFNMRWMDKNYEKIGEWLVAKSG
ncbi:aminopeptidase N [Ixodes scapularis]|uniref:aminopeptidase N n=1 Tax=Ixodes scapularis TaxID=6945 RepID=UPI001C38AD09|nr:aminopeptidase N [Ixodes scapularis]